ncbi:MAG: TonB-dependent receptor, partial [Comamonadaceae bacterium]|nr:TonB-dependent receptor [Comamonadaceae bacterium]
LPGYTLWNAGLGYDTRLAGQRLTLRLQGRNLGNRYHYPGVNGGGLQIGRPREVFLSARLQF